MTKVIYKWEGKQFKLIFARKKVIYLRNCGIFKSANNNWVRKSQIRKSPKIYGPQILKPQIDTFVEGPKIYKKRFKSANLRICGFAELICGPPTFASKTRKPHVHNLQNSGKNTIIVSLTHINFFCLLTKIHKDCKYVKRKRE
jgi:hypothetical protein